VKFSLDDAEKFIRDMADGTTELTQASKGFALVGALEGGQMLTPKIAGVHWTLCEAPVSEPWITTDTPSRSSSHSRAGGSQAFTARRSSSCSR
jgi:hypothetical protein